jgi:hypothetical protein
MPDLAFPTTAHLWLPILLSAVAVFIVSSIIHMALPIHKGDWKKLPNEEGVLKGLRDAGLPPGEYMFPCAGSMKEMGDPAFQEKLKRGPVGNMTLIPNGPFAMGRALLQWFLFSVVVSTFAGYIGAFAAPFGAGFSLVFRVVGTAAILGYAFSNVTNSIWKGASWTTTIKFVVDGVVYGATTGAVFAALWPSS